MICLKRLAFIYCAMTCLSTAAPSEESYETVTSITTYSTRAGVQRGATPAFVIKSGTKNETLSNATQARLIQRLRSGDDSHLQTQIWKGQHVELRRDTSGPLTPEEEFAFAKTSGAIFIGAFFGPEVALAYAVGAATTGVFSPLEKIINDESDKDELFARVALVDHDGKITRAHYRAVASDRSGIAQTVYYVRRSLATPSSSSFIGSYILGEVVSFLTGATVKVSLPKATVLGEELAGYFLAPKAETAFREASTPNTASDGQGGFTTMMVPDGFGGWRTMFLPKPTLKPSVSAPTLTPKLEVQTFGLNDAPPFAIEQAVTTFRSAGANTVQAEELAPDVVLVTPDYFAAEVPSNPSDDGAGSNQVEPDSNTDLDTHSIDNLPKSIEIHGLGSFSISR